MPLLIIAGRLQEADQWLTEAATIRARIGDYSTHQNGNINARVQWLIASGRAAEAPPLLKEFRVKPATGNSVSVTQLQRAILQARVDLASGKSGAVHAGLREVRTAVEGSHLQSYLRTYEADATLLEGRAHLAEGDAAAALPLLQQSHQLYGDLYDERSLLTADAKVALAQCLLALGKRDEARTLAQQAAAIQGTHRDVGEHLRAPLRALQQAL